jgi:hypothetical protein
MPKKKEAIELSETEKLKILVREERPDLDDEGVEKEVAQRLRPTGGGYVGNSIGERGGQPSSPPERTEDNPKPQGTF